MKRCTVRIPFHDLREDVAREQGDIFVCDNERAEQLVEWAIVWAGPEAEEPEAEPSAKKTRKK